MALYEYMRQVQSLIRDEKQEQINPDNIVRYVNRARRECAMRAQCLRFLTPISGQIVSATVTAGGSGYTSAPTVTIAAPDYPLGAGPKPQGDQATATAQIAGGVVSAVNINYGGYGYFQPTITFSGGGGTGAAATPNLSYINTLNAGQEVYNFSSVTLSGQPGFSLVHSVISVSIIFSNYRYSLPIYSMSTYQSLIRQYANTYQYVSFFGAQYGRGASGSFYFFPLPSQQYQMEWDCVCLPIDLVDDTSVEAIPLPWQDAIPWLSASYCYNELQNWNAARYYQSEFDRYMSIYGRAASPGRQTNQYGRAFA